MAAPADTLPSSATEKTQSPVQQVILPSQDAKLEVVKESSPTSVFVNSEPIREEQVQNAVKFLSHPKVRGSPVMYRRSFLERKGLTKEEIDEAFRRVPDPTPTVTTTEPVVTNQDGQMKSSYNVQTEAPTQVLQSNPVVPVGTISKMGMISRFHWSHALLAVGFLAVSGAGTVVLFKNAIIPRLKSWIRKVVSEEEEGLLKKINGRPSVLEEAAVAAKAAAAAAADVAQASQQMLMTKNEEKKFFEELISMLNAQVNEMKSMRNSIQKLEGVSGQSTSGRIAAEQRDDQRVLQTRSRVNQPGSSPFAVPRPKPWEVSQAQVSSTSILQTQGNQLSDDDSVPWWQRKNVRITEIEPADEKNLQSSNALGNERPVQRSWVPPQPPPVAMPEAAVAIRQPKKLSYQKEQTIDDQSVARSPDVMDELQRITKISESGGTMEANGETSVHYSAEMEKEENGSYSET